MSDFVFEVKGLEQVNARLVALAETSQRAAVKALREEAEIEMTEAKRRTPVRFGDLRRSGHVTGPTRDSGWAVVMAFGGQAAPYAVHVHENLEAFHRVGQAKFLESVLLESAPYLAERVARRMFELMFTG